MRNFQPLDHVLVDNEAETIQLSHGDSGNAPNLVMHREGPYITISASLGPLEIALRPRYEDLIRTLGRLPAVDGLHFTRQVGTAQAFLAVGLMPNGELLLRPTIVADATGYLSMNLELSSDVRKALYNWLKLPAS
ncbi:MAG: hypothetical protein ACYDBJ_20190 [Aggregatilineales bacterium]